MKSFLLALALTAQAQSWPDLSSPPSEGGGEKDAAVIVGIEKYAFVSPVQGAAKNAADWYAYLTKGRKVPTDRVKLLLNNDSTLEGIRAAAESAAKDVQPGGRLWFVFIGHGAPSKRGDDGVLIGVDAQQKADSLYARSLSRHELLTTLGKGPQEETLVLLDSCFSGRGPDGQALAPGLQPLVVAAGAAPVQARNMIVLTAARGDQFAGPLPGASRPAFSYLALGALRGWAGEGDITARDVLDYAKRTLASFSAQLAASNQEPELSYGDPYRKLATGRERGPDIAAMVLKSAAAQSDVSFEAKAIAMPKIDLKPATGLKDLNIEVEKKLERALDLQESNAAVPWEKADAWCGLAELKDGNPYLKQARKACAEWTEYGDAFVESLRGFDADWKKLRQYFELRRKTKEQRLAILAAFEQTYGPMAKSWPVFFDWASQDLAKAKQAIVSGGEVSLAEKGPILYTNALGRTAARMKAKSASKPDIEWVKIPKRTLAFTRKDHEQEWGRDWGGKTICDSGHFRWVHKVTGEEKCTHQSQSDFETKRQVRVSKFKAAKTLVTNAQYRACVTAGACPRQEDGCLTEKEAGDDQPAVCMGYDGAAAFAKWMGGRLPSMAEWHSMAMALPWFGRKPTCDETVVKDSAGEGCGKGASWPVCSKTSATSPDALCDALGNVRNWIQDDIYDRWEQHSIPEDGTAWRDPKGRRGSQACGFDWSNEGFRWDGPSNQRMRPLCDYPGGWAKTGLRVVK